LENRLTSNRGLFRGAGQFFYNPQRKHVRNGMLSPIDFEQQQKLKL